MTEVERTRVATATRPRGIAEAAIVPALDPATYAEAQAANALRAEMCRRLGTAAEKELARQKYLKSLSGVR